MPMRLLILSLCAFAPFAARAQNLPPFDPAPIAACLAAAAADTDRLACAGMAANVCMATEAGSSNVGMGGCLVQERDWWEAQRDAAAGRLADVARRNDAVLNETGSAAARAEPLAADAEAAWRVWKDADCAYEGAFWGGGSGTGVAIVSCDLQHTAARFIRLEALLRAYSQ